MVKPSERTKSIGVKVTEEEYAQMEALAGGRPVGTWAYEVLAQQLERGGTATAEQVTVAEILALRTILLNVLYKLSNGEAIKAQEMQTLIDRADADKLKKAAERLQGTR